MSEKILIGSWWKHVKTGKNVLVHCVSKHTETGEKLVTYFCGGEYWTRPYEMFLDGRFEELK